MLIYLDTRDLINLFERGEPISPSAFADRLASGEHKLVLSFYNIREISQPLFSGSATTVVTRVLNSIEEVPHLYIRLFELDIDELKEAARAFSAGQEYRQIQPFADRLDKSMEREPSGPFKLLLRASAAEIVFTCFWRSPNILRQPSGTQGDFIQLLQRDRERPVPSFREYLQSNFSKAIRWRSLGSTVPNPHAFIDWVSQNAERCPSLRLTHELYYQLVRDKTATLDPNDFPDLAHALAIPYVDLVTLDGTMREYARRACRDANAPQWNAKICNDAKQVLDQLERGRVL